MRIMLTILGEGRGHMTQALSVKEIVARAGHEVVSTVLGMGSHREVPPFFAGALQMPIARIPTLEFSFANNRKVSLPATLWSIAARVPRYYRAVRKLKAVVRETQPDVIINFFEPL